MTYLDWQGKGCVVARGTRNNIAGNKEQYANTDNPINTIVPEVASSVTGRELIRPGTEPEKQNKMRKSTRNFYKNVTTNTNNFDRCADLLSEGL